MHVPSGSCDDVLRTLILEERGRLQGTLEIVADRDDADVIAADAQRLHKIYARTVANQSVCHVGEHGVHAVFAHVDRHDLVPQFIELSGAVSSKSS